VLTGAVLAAGAVSVLATLRAAGGSVLYLVLVALLAHVGPMPAGLAIQATTGPPAADRAVGRARRARVGAVGALLVGTSVPHRRDA
jgi:hypothetical protein